MTDNLLPYILALGFSIPLSVLSAHAAAKLPIPPAKVDTSLATATGQETAVFAGGCFWGVKPCSNELKAW